MKKVLKIAFSMSAVLAVLLQFGVLSPTAEAAECDCVGSMVFHFKPTNDGETCYCIEQQQLVAVITCKFSWNNLCNPVNCD
jgi:hypothetical protein